MLKSIIIHPVNEYKVMDCFLFLLVNNKLFENVFQSNGFPSKISYDKSGNIIEDYNITYENICLKILFIISKLSQNSVSFFLEINNKTNTLKKLDIFKGEKTKGQIQFLLFFNIN